MLSGRKEILEKLELLGSILQAEMLIQKREAIIDENLKIIEFANKALSEKEGFCENNQETQLDCNQYKDFVSQEAFNLAEHQFNMDSLQKIHNWQEEFNDFFPRKYYNRIESVAELIKNLRADSIKEAINLMLHHDYELELARSIYELQAEMELIHDLAQEQLDLQYCGKCQNEDRCRHYGQRESHCFSRY